MLHGRGADDRVMSTTHAHIHFCRMISHRLVSCISLQRIGSAAQHAAVRRVVQPGLRLGGFDE